VQIADVLFLRTLLLLTPGVVACKLSRALGAARYERAWEAIVDAVLFSITGYAAAGWIGGRDSAESLASFVDSSAPVPWRLVGWSVLTATCIAVLFTYAEAHRWLYRTGKWLQLTERVMRDDVWTYFLASKGTDWQLVWDHARGLYYYGTIFAYSESEMRRELWMLNVSVYDARDAELLYFANDLYWSGAPGEVTIEARPRTKHERAPEQAERV
jgi:hypothetical protein